MHEIVERVTISDDKSKSLERAFFELQAYRNILYDAKKIDEIINANTNKLIIEQISKGYQQAQYIYDETWRAIRTEYFGSKYETDEFSCSCQFDTCEVCISRIA